MDAAVVRFGWGVLGFAIAAAIASNLSGRTPLPEDVVETLAARRVEVARLQHQLEVLDCEVARAVGEARHGPVDRTSIHLYCQDEMDRREELRQKNREELTYWYGAHDRKSP